LFTDVESALIAAEAARRTAKFALFGSLMTFLGVIVAAVITQISSSRTQRKIKALEQQNSEALARLNAQISTAQSEDDARRDYEYEARKRLYKECEPVLFRLFEASENALHRVFSLARTARNGNLGASESWLDSPDYYMASTVYHLLVPSATFRLLKERLTMVDLTVDEAICRYYIIAKRIYLSFTEDFALAKFAPTLEYDPFADESSGLRETYPEKHSRQGLTLGDLDVAIENLLKEESPGSFRCLTFGEFEMAFYQDVKAGGSRFGSFAEMLLKFHPLKRPILWRILVVQAKLYSQILESFASRRTNLFTVELPSSDAAFQQKLDWRSQLESTYPSATIEEPLKVADIYLKRAKTLT
jgi:hypothetical protein